MRILVVDDHHSVRRVVCAILTAEGWDVCGEAVNGREAVEMVVTLKPDVVVLDLCMPEMNGLDATRHILQRRPDTEVVILTLYDGEDLARAAVESGARACVGKTDLDHLVVTLRTLFQSGNGSEPQKSLEEPALVPGETPDDPIASLTDVELQILQLLAQSKTNKEIAIALSVSVKTVQVYRSAIMDKLGLNTVVECVRYAVRHVISRQKQLV